MYVKLFKIFHDPETGKYYTGLRMHITVKEACFYKSRPSGTTVEEWVAELSFDTNETAHAAGLAEFEFQSYATNRLRSICRDDQDIDVPVVRLMVELAKLDCNIISTDMIIEMLDRIVMKKTFPNESGPDERNDLLQHSDVPKFCAIMHMLGEMTIEGTLSFDCFKMDTYLRVAAALIQSDTLVPSAKRQLMELQSWFAFFKCGIHPRTLLHKGTHAHTSMK
jgi:hypothetical protein